MPAQRPGGGGGGSVAASSITDSTATGRALITAADAAAARTAIGTPSVTTYDFSSATGVTLTNRSGTAAVTGGALTLTTGTGAHTDLYTSTNTAPGGSVSLLTAGRSPARVRARARVASMTLGGASKMYAFLTLHSAAGARYEVFAGSDGTVAARRGDTGPTSAGTGAGAGVATAAIAGGTLYLEAEASGPMVALRYSLDGAVWTEIGTLVDSLGGWASAQCLATVPTGETAPSTSAVTSVGDLWVETWP